MLANSGNGVASTERFTKTLFGGGAQSTLGYRVFFNSRTSIEYVDGATKLFVGVELLTPRMTMALYPEYMTVGSPDGSMLADKLSARRRSKECARQLGSWAGPWTE